MHSRACVCVCYQKVVTGISDLLWTQRDFDRPIIKRLASSETQPSPSDRNHLRCWSTCRSHRCAAGQIPCRCVRPHPAHRPCAVVRSLRAISFAATRERPATPALTKPFRRRQSKSTQLVCGRTSSTKRSGFRTTLPARVWYSRCFEDVKCVIEIRDCFTSRWRSPYGDRV